MLKLILIRSTHATVFLGSLLFSTWVMAQNGSGSEGYEAIDPVIDHDEVDRLNQMTKWMTTTKFPRAFASKYETLHKSIVEENRALAKESYLALKSMQKKNPFSEIQRDNFELLSLYYHRLMGDEQNSTISLSNIVESKSRHIPVEIYSTLATHQLRRQIQDKQYLESKQTFDALSESEANNDLTGIVSVMKKVDALIDQSEPIVIDHRLNEAGRWTAQMMRRAMFVDAIDGAITEQLIECEGKSATIPFNPEGELRVPKSWGQCTLTLLGQPNAEFQLVQAKP